MFIRRTLKKKFKDKEIIKCISEGLIHTKLPGQVSPNSPLVSSLLALHILSSEVQSKTK